MMLKMEKNYPNANSCLMFTFSADVLHWLAAATRADNADSAPSGKQLPAGRGTAYPVCAAGAMTSWQHRGVRRRIACPYPRKLRCRAGAAAGRRAPETVRVTAALCGFSPPSYLNVAHRVDRGAAAEGRGRFFFFFPQARTKWSSASANGIMEKTSLFTSVVGARIPRSGIQTVRRVSTKRNRKKNPKFSKFV